MVEPCFLDFLDQRVRQVRGNQSVFGGIQATSRVSCIPLRPLHPRRDPSTDARTPA